MSTDEIRSADLRCASDGRFTLVRRLFVGGRHPVCYILADSPKATVAFGTGC